jgi:TolB-like protein/tetratricopeptide (TPR) repeat protein
MPRTLALLPFDNADRNPDADYLTQGLTQELTRSLSRLSSVRVVRRTSASTVTGTGRSLQEIGRLLNVNAVLAGELQNSNGRRRVSARLVDVADGAVLWSKTYEPGPADLIALPRELAVQIATALAIELSPVERGRIGRPGTRSHEALASYMKGRYFANQRNAAAYRLAIGYFAQAIAADSQYGAPWAGLAAVYSQQGMSGQLSPQEAQRLAKTAALRAVALDDASAEAHAILGVYLHDYAWSSQDAERELRRAIELDPGYALAHFYYSTMLRSVHRFDEAIAQLTIAIELDPLVPAFNETLGFTLIAAGRMDEALPRLRTALELDSTYWRAHAVLGYYFELTHRYEDAVREYERANQLAGPTAHRTTADLARLAALTGRKDEAVRLVAMLQSRTARTAIYEPAVASAYHALGDDASAYNWLEHSYRQRQPELRFLIGDRRFQSMLGDPRFIALLGRLRLPR